MPISYVMSSRSQATPKVTVVLPIHVVDDPAGLERAFGSITAQTLPEIEILLICNGSDEGTLSHAARLASGESRARVLTLPHANLAAALNRGLSESRCELVARMDADDWSHPDRLRVQCAWMDAHPGLAAVGSRWVKVDAVGNREEVHIPTDPAELAWRMLLGNVLAHGSMMLRRSKVAAAGGYDAACTRAQDYDLWLRLLHTDPASIGAVPHVLYEYSHRHAGGREASAAAQARIAARSLLRAWCALPPAGDSQRERLAEAIAAGLGGHQTGEAAAGVEALLSEAGPSAQALIARLWLHWNATDRGSSTAEICRRARVREVTSRLKAAGATSIYLWGAGRHTAWLLEDPASLALPVAGVVDDAAAGSERFGYTVASPAELMAGSWVLISSDGFEEQIWRIAEGARARGVRVWRIYGKNPGE